MEYLLKTYGKFGITENLLIRLVKMARVDFGYSTEQALALLRYAMAITFHNTAETFSLRETALITGEDYHTVLQRMETLVTAEKFV